jgi:hypothetical protein
VSPSPRTASLRAYSIRSRYRRCRVCLEATVEWASSSGWPALPLVVQAASCESENVDPRRDPPSLK